MKIGTRSILFGVHAFWWHPVVVALAWREYHHQWPRHLTEWVAIFCHDLGYWGAPDIDGAIGKEHPWRSANLAEWVMRWLGRGSVANRVAVVMHVLGHSRSFCRQHRLNVSPLCAPDKLSVLFEPTWFYFLRASLSGELHEFVDNAAEHGFTADRLPDRWRWIKWYKDRTRKEFYGQKKG
jgi:hypothetical protein